MTERELGAVMTFPEAELARFADAQLPAMRDCQQMLIEAGFEATLQSNAAEFRPAVMADVAHWRQLITALDLKID